MTPTPQGPRGPIPVHFARDPTHLSESIFSLTQFPHPPAPELVREDFSLAPSASLTCTALAAAVNTFSPAAWALPSRLHFLLVPRSLCLWWQSVWSTLCPTSPPHLLCLSCSSLCPAVPCLCLPPAALHLAPAALWTGLATPPPRGLLSHKALHGLGKERVHWAHSLCAHMQFGLRACPEVWGHYRHPEGYGPSWAAGA